MGEHEGLEQVINLERNLETRRLNIDLALRRCQRKGWQPRDYFLQATLPLTEMPDVAETAVSVQENLRALPDVNWATTDRAVISDELFTLAKPLLVAEFEQGRGNVQPADHWQEAGTLRYEFYDPDAEPGMPTLGTEPIMIIHLPSQAEHLSRTELAQSLHLLAQALHKRTDLKGVYGSSLLLEHPLFRRLGFTIDEKHDDGLKPSMFIPRQEFIERFDK